MRFVVVVLLLSWSNPSTSQKLIRTLDSSSDFSTNVFYFYEDSTFAYVRGGCTSLNLTMGKWFRKKNDYHLIPFQTYHPKITVIDQVEGDSCDLFFDAQFFDSENQLIPGDWTLIDTTNTLQNVDVDQLNVIDRLQRLTVLGIDTNFRTVKRECKDYELLPTNIYRAFNCQELIPISDRVSFISLQVNIPRQVARFMLFGILSYSTMSSDEFTYKNERFIIED